MTVTDPAHVSVAKMLRAVFSADKLARERAARYQGDRHRVSLRALSDYDAPFGSDFTTSAEKATS